MQKLYAASIVAILLIAATVPQLTAISAPSQTAASVSSQVQKPATTTIDHSEPRYHVLKVVDGDTVAIEMEGKSVTIRLIGLDTPETLDPRKPVQCFGREATARARELLEGQDVSIETDATQGDRDTYGRLLVYVYLPDGSLFNELMIAEGYAHEYTYALPYTYQSQFKTAEKIAREQKLGLWADDACAEESLRDEPKPVVAAPSGNFECSKNTYNCMSFKTQSEAQSAFDTCGGSAHDIHKLDSDKDGTVCESLP